MRKILLINVPSVRIRYNISGVYPMLPLGLAYIASILEKNNFQVRVLDMSALKIRLEKVSSYLTNDDYSIYGLSCNIFNLGYGIRLSQVIKRLRPKAKVILGGRCANFPSEIIFKYGPYFDIIVRGEGEEAMLNICKSLHDNSDFNSIGGISYKNNGEIVDNLNSCYVKLENLPLPARHLLPNEYYGMMHPPFGIYPPVATIEISRGCAYRCAFCNLPSPVRERPVISIIEEIKETINKFGAKEIHFIDPNFTYNRVKIMELCNCLINNKIKIAWTCKTRVDLVDEELLRMMADAGCYMISYGVESGSQKILDFLNKDVSLPDIENAFRLTRSVRIRTLAYILLGSPGENDGTVRETTNLVKRICPDFVLYGEFLPDPNSVLTRRLVCEKKLNYEDLADFYIFGKGPLTRRTVSGMSKNNINRWVSLANRSFYWRIGYIFWRLKEIKNVIDFLNLLKGVYFLAINKLVYKENKNS